MAGVAKPLDRRAAILSVESNFAETWWQVAAANGAQLVHEGHVRWFTFQGLAPDPRTTAVMPIEVPADQADETIAGVSARFRELGRSGIWWVTPSSRPRDLSRRLVAQGWELWGRWPAMAIELVQLPPMSSHDGFEVRPVASDEDFGTLGSVLEQLGMYGAFARAFVARGRSVGWQEDDTFRHFVGWEGGRPVACASLVEAGAAAGLYAVAVVEDARRRGYGRAVSLAAMHAGAARGHRFGVLQTSELGYGVYRGIGFKLVCRLTPYLLEV